MSNSKIQIVVACGSGVATSTIAADAVKELLTELGIQNYNLVKTSMTELPNMVDSTDVILTTNNYKTDEKPCLNIMGFVTGINEEKLKSQLAEIFLNLK
ncbi:PTS sugar transporter subunit IIB [Peribacillus loiseleuriae]|uniref:PTS galactitol transporter subunit IIB n=1 Tax=Peribacillus loiseleuriae TaxID=1679170 RepID=A0A0K9GU09_9BACI|nr:PTS sugar transporter subunit IIB [Peribacillus loiseleuriae]KMY49737.1 PTS galactitol transporter subunit IIB [Peribacillus loiseleuriae]